MARKALLIAVVASLTIGSPGCSFLFIDGPSDTYREGWAPSCDTGRSWAYIDTIFAVLYLSMGTAFATDDEGGVAASSLLTGGLWAASAVTGFRRTGRCKERRAEHERWLIQLRQNPQVLQPTSGSSWDAPPSGWESAPTPAPAPAPAPAPDTAPAPAPTDPTPAPAPDPTPDAPDTAAPPLPPAEQIHDEERPPS